MHAVGAAASGVRVTLGAEMGGSATRKSAVAVSLSPLQPLLPVGKSATIAIRCCPVDRALAAKQLTVMVVPVAWAPVSWAAVGDAQAACRQAGKQAGG